MSVGGHHEERGDAKSVGECCPAPNSPAIDGGYAGLIGGFVGDLQGSGLVCEIAMPAQLTDAPLRSLNGMIDLFRPPRFALCGWLAGAHDIRHPRVGR